MADQKMREALEQIQALTEIPFAHTAGDHELIYQIAREALASAQPEGPELTDAEIDEIWARHAMSDTFDCVHLLRDAIAADRARRGGAEEKSPSAAEIAENVAALEEIRNSEWGKAAQEWAATPPAAPVVPEEWRALLEELTNAHHHAVMAAHPHRHYPGNMDRFQLDMAVVERAQSLLAAPAPEQREKVELTDAEIEERWWGELDNRSLSSIRAVLAAYEAKQKGGAA